MADVDVSPLGLGLKVASQLVAGDVLVLPGDHRRRVVATEVFEELTGAHPGPRVRVLVEGGQSSTWEGVRSGHHGVRSGRLETMGLRPFLLDELVQVDRG